ncbi:hypothetical protein JD969_10045 [Planctomycetota bacterium]|nr:hypothetical protein JD969_10045 [Planctomycetota bacterium]
MTQANPSTKHRKIYCMHCYYNLNALSTCFCPECGHHFDTQNPETYTTLSSPISTSKFLFTSAIAPFFVSLLTVGTQQNFLWFHVLLIPLNIAIINTILNDKRCKTSHFAYLSIPLYIVSTVFPFIVVNTLN